MSEAPRYRYLYLINRSRGARLGSGGAVQGLFTNKDTRRPNTDPREIICSQD